MNWYKYSQRENDDIPQKKHFSTYKEAKDYLNDTYKGHGRVETLKGEVVSQCRCGGGETVIIPKMEDPFNNKERWKELDKLLGINNELV